MKAIPDIQQHHIFQSERTPFHFGHQKQQHQQQNPYSIFQVEFQHPLSLDSLDSRLLDHVHCMYRATTKYRFSFAEFRGVLGATLGSIFSVDQCLVLR